MQKFKLITFTIVLWVVLLYFTFGDSKLDEYEENGVPVTVTITEKGRVVRSTYYKGVYFNDEGEEMVVNVHPNRFGVELGDELEGSFLPESPDEVYCQLGLELKIICYAFAGIGYAIAIFLTYLIVTHRK